MAEGQRAKTLSGFFVAAYSALAWPNSFSKRVRRAFCSGFIARTRSSSVIPLPPICKTPAPVRRDEGGAIKSSFFDFQVLRCRQLNDGIVSGICLQPADRQIYLRFIRLSIWLSVAIKPNRVVRAVDDRDVDTFSGEAVSSGGPSTSSDRKRTVLKFSH